jgi:hypothetical protein
LWIIALPPPGRDAARLIEKICRACRSLGLTSQPARWRHESARALAGERPATDCFGAIDDAERAALGLLAVGEAPGCSGAATGASTDQAQG